MTEKAATQIKNIEISLKDQIESFYQYTDSVSELTNKPNLLIILNKIRDQDIDKIRGFHKQLNKYIGDIKVFTKTEFENGLDVFPIEFLSIKQNAQLISGQDILSKVFVNKTHLRHECEFYLRSHLLTLRESLIKNTSQPQHLIKESFPSFISVLRQFQTQELSVNNIENGKDVIVGIERMLSIQLPTFKQLSLDLSINKNSDLKTTIQSYLSEIATIIRAIDDQPI